MKLCKLAAKVGLCAACNNEAKRIVIVMGSIFEVSALWEFRLLNESLPRLNFALLGLARAIFRLKPIHNE